MYVIHSFHNQVKLYFKLKLSFKSGLNKDQAWPKIWYKIELILIPYKVIKLMRICFIRPIPIINKLRLIPNFLCEVTFSWALARIDQSCLNYIPQV